MEEANAPAQSARKLQRAAPADTVLLQCAGVAQLLAGKDEAERLSREASPVVKIGFDRDGGVTGVYIKCDSISWQHLDKDLVGRRHCLHAWISCAVLYFTNLQFLWPCLLQGPHIIPAPCRNSTRLSTTRRRCYC